MRQLNKSKLISIRVTPDRKRLIQKAARAASLQRGERVTLSALLWELAEPGIRQLVPDESEPAGVA